MLNYLTQAETNFVGVVLLCVVISFMLYLFFSYHMYLVYYGYTTNEKMKTSQLKYYLERRVKFLKKWETIKQQDKNFEPAANSIDYYMVQKDWDIKKIAENKKDT